MAEGEEAALQPQLDPSSGASGVTEVLGGYPQNTDGSERSLGFKEGRNDDVVDSIDAHSCDFLETGDIAAMGECEADFQPRNKPLSVAELSAHSFDFSETGNISAMAESEADFQPRNEPLSVAELSAHSFDFSETGDISAMAECEAAFQPRNEPLSIAELSAHSSDVSETGDISAMAECEAAFQPRNEPLPTAELSAHSSDVSETGDISAMAEYEADFQPRKEPLPTAELSAHSSDVSETGDISAMAEYEAAFQPRNEPLSRAELSAHSSDVSDTGDISAMAECEAAFQPRNEPLSSAELSAHSSDVSETDDISAMAECEAAFQPRNEPLSAATSGDTEVRESQPQSRGGADFVSEIDNLNDMTPRKESKFWSGYDPEHEDDDNNEPSSVSSREVEADRGVEMFKRRRSQPEEEEGWGQGWEEIGTSTDLGWKLLPPILPETRPPRREVYRIPGSDAEEEDEEGENPPQLLTQPAGFIVGAVEFQLNLIVHVIAIGIWLFNFSLSSLSNPISRTVAVKDQVASVATGAVSQVAEVFSLVGERVSLLGEGVSQAGPTMDKLSKRTFWGCLSVVYVICMLGLLLIPALFVNVVVVNTVVENPLVIRQALDFDFTQTKPVALLSLFSSAEVERVQNLAPDKKVKTRVIPLGSKFHVTVVLTVPESDYNMKLGMFQVTAEVLSARDQVIMRSSKPIRLRFESYPIQLVKTLLYVVPHLLGLSKEEQTIQIRVLEAKEKAIPSASVRILIEPRATFHGGVPEIYEAAARLESTLPWPRSLMSSFKWLLFLWNGSCLFIFEVGVVLCCCRQMILPTFGRKVFAEEEIVVGEVKDGQGITEATRGSSKKARGNRRVYFEDVLPGAAESNERKGMTALKNEEKADGAGRDEDPVS